MNLKHSPTHHAPGIPCSAHRTHPQDCIWYTEEPEEITCKSRACQAARRKMLAERARLPVAYVLAGLEACG